MHLQTNIFMKKHFIHIVIFDREKEHKSESVSFSLHKIDIKFNPKIN